MIESAPLLLGSDGYNLNRSVRLRSSATAYFQRTPAGAGSLTAWTWSGWVKRGALGVESMLFSAGTGTSNPRSLLSFNATTNTLDFGDNPTGALWSEIITTAVFRDPAAWYHIVAVYDSANATSTDRLRLYVNGTRITAFNSATYPIINTSSVTNTAIVHRIGRYAGGAETAYFDGCMTEVNFIGGQALTPTSFGEYNLYGQWVPKKYAGTYGTNGFYLNFNDNSAATATTIGKDSSGLGNNWTPNNISVTAGSTYDSMTDVPTLTSATAANFAVLNPLDKGTTITVQSGNLEASISTTHNGVRNTFQIPTTGKWYWEITNGSTTGSNVILSFGLATSVASMNTYDYNTTGTYSLYASTDLQIISNGSGGITFGSAISSGTVCGVAYDATNGQLYLAVANTYYSSAGSGTGNPAGGTNATMAVASSLGLFPYEHIYADTFNANFGQRPFTYTPPTGYLALNTFNL